MDRLSGYNAAVYDNLPVSVIIYRVTEEDGAHDYEIVYGNRAFDRDFRRIYGHGDYLGTPAVRNRLIDERTLLMMESFRSGAPRALFPTRTSTCIWSRSRTCQRGIWALW